VRSAAHASPTAGAISRTRSLPRALAKACLASATLVALFAVAGSSAASAACPNEQFRIGPSANLPDCRAYELVTAPKYNGQLFPNTGTGALSEKFNSSPVSPSGNGYLWTLFASGLAPGESGGSNLYEAQRSGAGWVSKFSSPTPVQAETPIPGSADRNHEYITLEIEGFRGGTLAFEPGNISYVRYPDGTFHLLGEGTVPAPTDTDGFENGFVDDPHAAMNWIAAGGQHQIFEGHAQLTSDTPPSTVVQVYDRTPTGLHLVSLLPGEVSPTSSSIFAGSSADGSTILFKNGEGSNGGALYARVDNSETFEIASDASGSITPGGVNADGSKAFFVQGGDIAYYDVDEEEVKEVVSTGDATFAYVSPDGSHVYFISPQELVIGQGTIGAPNLYVWNGSSVKFIATVAFEDLAEVEGFFPQAGLEAWSAVVPTPVALNSSFLLDTARTTDDGSVFIFESKAQLTAFPNEGHVEIYRYATEGEQLICVSCSPSAPSASADSDLALITGDTSITVNHPTSEIPNLSPDGSTVFFESKESLLPADVNGVRDVYEWRSGELSLISTGHAAQPSALAGVSFSGNDVFFETGEPLVARGQEAGTIAIYDARVNGGLLSQQAVQLLECEGEGCLGQPSAPPALASPGSSLFQGKGNVRHCHKRRHRKGKTTKSKRRVKKSCRSGRRSSSK
jgi:hypothetical protein